MSKQQYQISISVLCAPKNEEKPGKIQAMETLWFPEMRSFHPKILTLRKFVDSHVNLIAHRTQGK